MLFAFNESDFFKLDDKFISQYVGKQPKWGPVGYVTYKRTYARALDTVYDRHKELGNSAGLTISEEFWLTLVRVVEGTYSIQKRHCRTLLLPWNEKKAQISAQEMYKLMWDFKFLPPGRGLWMMGVPNVERLGGAALNNCAFITSENLDIDFAEAFCFLMDYSMLGLGVGSDTRGAGKVVIKEPEIESSSFIVQDSREGWVALVRKILNSFVGKDRYPIDVDYSLIRPAGTMIRGFGGIAEGPDPLIRLVSSVTDLLRARIGKKIRSADIVDIFNMIGRCVVAGNVRRSAEIMFGDNDDSSFLELKDPTKNKKQLDSHRWASNNSIFAEVGQDYEKVANLIMKNGEPGCLWLENARRYSRMGHPPDFKDMGVMGANPCNEQSLFSSEICCLVETFPANHNNLENYLRTLKFAYLYAKTVTLVPTHNERTNAVTLMNRRIGCSMSGIIQAMKKFGRRNFFNMADSGYRYICDVDKIYSSWLCVPESKKKTSIKPSGTVSLLTGATAGIHHAHSEYYWRVIRFRKESYMVPILRDAGYTCIEIDPEKEPNTVAVYFPVKVENFDKGEADVSMWEQLEIAACMQQHWADNQVSVTVTFSKEESKDIKSALELYENRLKGVSFLPRETHGYEHAPYQTIDRETYDDAVRSLKPYVLNEAVNEVQERFCDGDKCVISYS